MRSEVPRLAEGVWRRLAEDSPSPQKRSCHSSLTPAHFSHVSQAGARSTILLLNLRGTVFRTVTGVEDPLRPNQRIVVRRELAFLIRAALFPSIQPLTMGVS